MILIAGEALIDMVANTNDGSKFTALPGGAAYNVACASGLLGLNPGFVCPISKDSLGELLLEHLSACQASAVLDQRVDAPTPLALVTVDADSQPCYSFYREGTADRALAQFDLNQVAPKNTQLLHISGFCLNDAEDFNHWLTLVKSVKAQGGIVSVDPNVRTSLISDEQGYRERIRLLITLADIVKVSDEDLAYLIPEVSLQEAKVALSEMTSLAIITLGAEGSEAFWHNQHIFVGAKKVEKLADTVGAGDCFSAAYLYQLHQLGIKKSDQLNELSEQQITQVLNFAGTSAAINCSRKGCQPPTADEVNMQLKS